MDPPGERMIPKMLLTFLALLGVSVASAKANGPEAVPTFNSGGWTLNAPATLPPLYVQASVANNIPTFTMVLPSGESIPLHLKPVSLDRLSNEEIWRAVEDTRTIVESAARLLYSKNYFATAIVTPDYMHTVSVDASWMLRNHLTEFDPIRAIFDDETLKAPIKEILESENSPSPAKLTAKQRFSKLITLLGDAVWESTIQAYWTYQISKSRNKRSNEIGIQIVFRAEVQFGMGGLNIMKTLPIVLSIGYNRETREVVFRRGIRKESMTGGTAWSLSLKMEIKRYRLIHDLVEAGDSRGRGFGAYKGESWYPPAPPIFAGVADSGRGFSSEGISIGLNLADLVPGSILNTVNAFEETQRVAYSAPLPNAGEWMKRLHQQVEASKSLFENTMTRGGRCEMLFKPARASR